MSRFRHCLKGIVLSVLIFLSMVPTALAQTADKVMVSGSATLSLIADTAVIYLNSAANEKTAAEARAGCRQIVDNLKNALQKSGIEDKDIVISDERLYGDGYGGNPSTRYTASNMIAVTVRNLSIIDEVIDAVVQEGVSELSNVCYTCEVGDQEAYDKALGLALAQATEKAEHLALASGRTLGGVLSIREVSSSQAFHLNQATEAELVEESMVQSTRSKIVTVYASVEVEFELRKKPLQ